MRPAGRTAADRRPVAVAGKGRQCRAGWGGERKGQVLGIDAIGRGAQSSRPVARGKLDLFEVISTSLSYTS